MQTGSQTKLSVQELKTILVVFILILSQSCKKFEREICVSTGFVTDLAYTSCTVKGNIIDLGAEGITQHGFCYSSSSDPLITDLTSKLGPITSEKAFTSNLTGLSPNTTYYIRAFAQNSTITSYGESKTFHTKAMSAPVITTSTALSITENTAQIGGEISDNGGASVIERGVFVGVSINSDATGYKYESTDGSGLFSVSISGLFQNTKYYFRAYAKNGIGTSLGEELYFTTDGPLSDYDGNSYNTVRIGSQYWMAENLKATHYPDGSNIPYITDDLLWSKLEDKDSDDAFCYYHNDSSSIYGALYTYSAAIKACPSGWHLPSEAEWSELANFLADNGYNYDGTTGGAGDKIAKAMVTGNDWNESTNPGTPGNSDFPAVKNSSGFSALPGNFRRDTDGTFDGAGEFGTWWSYTEIDGDVAESRYLHYDNVAFNHYPYDKKSMGNSVRCIRDE